MHTTRCPPASVRCTKNVLVREKIKKYRHEEVTSEKNIKIGSVLKEGKEEHVTLILGILIMVSFSIRIFGERSHETTIYLQLAFMYVLVLRSLSKTPSSFTQISIQEEQALYCKRPLKTI